MKKFLKIFLFSILGFLFAVFVCIHILYNTFSAGDKGIEVIESNLPYYNESYLESRQAFRSAAMSLSEKYEDAEIQSVQVPGKTDNDLIIDILYLPPVQDTEKLLVLSSGVHGVEGYTGSAIQQMFIQELITPDILSEMGILIIHAINPYGFKYQRRVTENNVDLNRGSETDSSLFEKKNPGYALLYDMINPEGKASVNRFFYIKAISNILKSSMSTTRQAIVQGQYEFPGGLFFGGLDFEPQIDSLRMILPDYLAPYETVLTIDLHTAYGTRNVLHLFPNQIDDPEIKAKTESVFEGHHIDWGDSGNFYTVSGGFADAFLKNLCADKQYLYMVFEWGTSDTDKTFGSIKSLQVMINENQGAHFGYKNDAQKKKILKAAREQDYPSSEAWRSNVMETGRDMLNLVLKTYPEIDK